MNAFLLNILAGFLQMVTFIIIVGWIWSILWGMNFVQLASKLTHGFFFIKTIEDSPRGLSVP